MNTTVEALKNTYVELGGKLTDTYAAIAGGIPVSDYVVIPDVINAIGQIAGTTIELPAVSGADDGSVLGVVSGKWAKVAPSGKEIQKATYTVTTTDGYAALNNKNIDGATIVGAIVTSQPTGVSNNQTITVVPSYQFGSGTSAVPTLSFATWAKSGDYVQLTPIADQDVTVDVYYILANDD